MDGILLFLLLAALIGLAVHGISTYNRLNPLREQLREAEGNIEVCMHKVASLTSQLVGIAKRYGFHEQTIHLQISRDRRKAQESAYQRNLQAVALISGFATNFPLLKADHTYLHLMDDLERLATEIQIKYEDYNGKARLYNTQRTSFPAIILSDMLGFAKASYLNPTRWYPDQAQRIHP